MRKMIFTILVSISILTSAQTKKEIEKTFFSSGENLSFRVVLSSALTGDITAGEASLKVSRDKEIIGGNSHIYVVAEGETLGLVEFFYKIEEKFESWIDDETILPLKFTRRTRENNYKKDDIVYFNHNKLTAQSLNKKINIPENTHDIISAFYFARMQDISNMKEGDSFSIPYYFDDAISETKVVYIGKQKITTGLGTFNCLVFKPLALTGRVFNQKYPLTFWVTDDKRRVPVLIESKLIVGKARAELISYVAGN